MDSHRSLPPGAECMSAHEEALLPHTLTLDAHIQSTLSTADLADRNLAGPLLFTEADNLSVPSRVILDPVLEPVDKLVWMVILLHSSKSGGCSAFPDYPTLATQANIASRSTLARALAILRLTRWLSQYGSHRHGAGVLPVKVYILHHQPLPLADAEYFNPDYLTYVAQSRQHGHARVRRVAEMVWARRTVVDVTNRPLTEEGFSSDIHVRHLSTPAVPPEPGRPSSPRAEISSFGSTSLVYPPRLSDTQKRLADRYLSPLPVELRQPVLDELQGRLGSERQGMQPVYDELRFLHSLCEAALDGTFVPNLGLKVLAARQDRLRQSPATKVHSSSAQPARQHTEGIECLAALRALFDPDRKGAEPVLGPRLPSNPTHPDGGG